MRIQTTIGELIGDRTFPDVAPTATVADAVDVMRNSGSDCVLVCEGDQLVGIFTERDFLNRIAAMERAPEATKVSEVMTSQPETLRSEDRVNYAINIMAHGGYRNVPIVEGDRAIANLSVRDVMLHLSQLFAELEDDGEGADEWTDLGGGG